MNVNVWLAISASGTTAIRTRLTTADEDYAGPITKTEHRIFRRMADFVTVERLFKKPTIGGKKWHLFSLNFTATRNAKTALDWIAANRPGHFVIVGAWHWDGRQVGTQWEIVDDERTGNTIGTPTYPIHPQLLKFMPDIIERDEDGNVISTTPAAVLTDVNLIQGQDPRRFVL